MTFAGSDIINRSMLDMEESRLYDVGAERRFLACIVKRPELIHDAAQRVPQHALFVEMHNYIYGAMRFVHTKVVEKGWDLSFDPIAMAMVAREMGAEYEQRFYRRTQGLEKIRELERLSIHVDIGQYNNFVTTLTDRATRVQAYRQARLLQEQLMAVNPRPWAPGSGAHTNVGYRYYPKGYYVRRVALEKTDLAKLPILRDGSCVRRFTDEFLFAKTPSHALIVHTSPITNPADPDAGFGFGGGALSAFWTKATGSVKYHRHASRKR